MNSSSDQHDDADYFDSLSENDFSIQLRLAKEGNQEKKAELLDGFRDFLRSIAKFKMNHEMRAKLSTSDFVQDALIAAQKGFETCRANNKEEVKAWLRKILLHQLLNHYRDWRRLKRDVRREQPVSGMALEDRGAEPPGDLVDREEDERRLMQALEKLSLQERQLVEMRHRDSMSFTEIGKVTGQTPAATRLAWNRAIERLAKILN